MFLQECLCWTEAQSDFHSWSVTREPWTWSWQVGLWPARKRSSWDSPIDSSKLDRVTNMLTSNSYAGHLITWSDTTCFQPLASPWTWLSVCVGFRKSVSTATDRLRTTRAMTPVPMTTPSSSNGRTRFTSCSRSPFKVSVVLCTVIVVICTCISGHHRWANESCLPV